MDAAPAREMVFDREALSRSKKSVCGSGKLLLCQREAGSGWWQPRELATMKLMTSSTGLHTPRGNSATAAAPRVGSAIGNWATVKTLSAHPPIVGVRLPAPAPDISRKQKDRPPWWRPVPLLPLAQDSGSGESLFAPTEKTIPGCVAERSQHSPHQEQGGRFRHNGEFV